MTTRSPPRLLLTGFEPFGPHTVNPSWEIARALHGEVIGGLQVRAEPLPCVFGESAAILTRLMHTHQPRRVVCLGLAASRQEISLERVALNLDDAPIPDNRGAQPIDAPIVAGAPPAYWTGLPVKAMVEAVRSAGLPAGLSQTAGTYVCNHVFYALMHELNRQAAQPVPPAVVQGGFIHVPDAGAAWPSSPLPDARRWTLPDLVNGIRVALDAAARAQPEHMGLGSVALHTSHGRVD